MTIEARTIARPWRTFGLLALVEFVVVLDTSIVNIALPAIQEDLGFTPTGLAWVVDAYLLTFAGFLLVGGRLADRVGRRRLFLAGLGLFTLASLANALATAEWHLIASRGLQGLGGAMAVPAAIALISDLFDKPAQRSKALGIFSGMGGVAAAIGVVAGGALTTFGWQWIFLINIPVGAAVLLLGARGLPAGSDQVSGRIDVLGAISGTGALSLLILAAVQGGHQGWASASTIAAGVSSVVLLAVFLVRQRTAVEPMLPTPLLRQRDVRLGNAALATIGTTMFGTFFLITLYMQHVRGLTPQEAGLLYLPIPLALIAGTQLAPRIAGRIGPRQGLAVGLAIQAVDLAWWAMAIRPDAAVVVGFLAPTTLWSLGAGISLVSSFILSTSGISGPLAGAASGMATTSQNAGGALGLAALVAIAATRTTQLTAETDAAAQTGGYALALATAAVLALLGLLFAVGLQPHRRREPLQDVGS